MILEAKVLLSHCELRAGCVDFASRNMEDVRDKSINHFFYRYTQIWGNQQPAILRCIHAYLEVTIQMIGMIDHQIRGTVSNHPPMLLAAFFGGPSYIITQGGATML